MIQAFRSNAKIFIPTFATLICIYQRLKINLNYALIDFNMAAKILQRKRN